MARRKIAGAVTIITGASQGIGRAASILFARSGARVVLAAREPTRLEELAGEIVGTGSEALAVPTDVTNENDVKSLTAKTLDRFGRIDILICNAGVGLYSPVQNLPIEALRATFDVNFYGVLHCIQQVLPSMLEQRSGLVQVISSVIGRRSVPGYAGYCSTKFALYALVEALRVEMRMEKTGIDVQTVYPSLTDTPFPDNAIISNPGGHPSRIQPMPPEVVARHMLNAALTGKRDQIVSMAGKALALLNGVAPGLVDRVISLAFRGRWLENGLAVPRRRQ